MNNEELLGELRWVLDNIGKRDVLRYEEAIEAAIKALSSATGEAAQGYARYEYIRTLNPRQFAALFNDVLSDDGGNERFDDLVDRYRDAGGRQK